ncbi:MAG TPA: tryptophan halogenase family protein [Steroidobacteraceae bacterium]|nr:tryptophan halogenase family protein [Steroidobacteraceae bacterium]
MSTREVRKVVIAGGGTAGWVAAAALSHQFRDLLEIVLIESEEIGTIGVGESTIPPIRTFHRLLGIGEQEFMRATAATFKLGISFEGWRTGTDHYIHPFGITGKSTWACDFHHFWLHGLAKGIQSELGDYCIELQAAKAKKFFTSPQSEINYAYHLDAGIYAKFLRKFSEGFGAKRIEGKIKEVKQNAETGFIEALTLESGQTVEGDFFIDCTGFRGLLIEQTLKTGYEDWNQWLLCDRAAAVQTESVGPAVPYTRVIAHQAGWRWRIPLQHRVGNGLVYSSRFESDEQATDELMRSIEGKNIADPRVIRFRPGRRLRVWNKNVLALGLASGFVEPLESTSIHVVMTGVIRLIQLFPFGGVTQSFADEYNDQARTEMERIRDFIILHYKVNERTEGFWKHCREMEVPESLSRRIAMFQERAHAWQADGELFKLDSWTHVMLGQGILPAHYHQLTRALSDEQLKGLLDGIRNPIANAVERMPTHQEFIDRYCKAGVDVWGPQRAS